MNALAGEIYKNCGSNDVNLWKFDDFRMYHRIKVDETVLVLYHCERSVLVFTKEGAMGEILSGHFSWFRKV